MRPLFLLPVLAIFSAAGVWSQVSEDFGGNVYLSDVIIHSATGEPPRTGSLLIRDGRIVSWTALSEVPAGTRHIAGGGRLHVTPGLIDCHSHIALAGGLNEATDPVTCEVRILDAIDPDDPSIFRALAGGTTMANLLHGSANVIGGQNAVIKLRKGQGPDDLVFQHAPRGVKFALGENPKKSNSTTPAAAGSVYPSTRMGVEQILRRSFTDARSYQSQWKRFEAEKLSGRVVVPPRRDLRMEALVEILEGKILVHCHAYRADEMLMLMRVADDFGFKVRTFQHVLEGYKIGRELAEHGVGASTFSDWWAFKLEAFDATPYNAELMRKAGVLVSLNSDSADVIRRLNHEAAKMVRYGGYPEDLALQLVTLNPAKQLGIDRWVGSIEIGKDGDLAVFDGHPLSATSVCLYTLIEGRVYFDRAAELASRSGLERVLSGLPLGEKP